MKYIRTKDKEGKQYIISDRNYVFQIRDNEVIFARGYEEELLGQADTIEELCDVFVIPAHINKLYSYEVAKEHWQYRNYDVFGAIWTEWGLKYVAKMNEKGELELL